MKTEQVLLDWKPINKRLCPIRLVPVDCRVVAWFYYLRMRKQTAAPSGENATSSRGLVWITSRCASSGYYGHRLPFQCPKQLIRGDRKAYSPSQPIRLIKAIWPQTMSAHLTPSFIFTAFDSNWLPCHRSPSIKHYRSLLSTYVNPDHGFVYAWSNR